MMGAIKRKTVAELEQRRLDRQRDALVSAVQAHMDLTAQERGYDGMLSLCSYASDPEPRFLQEGQAGIDWRSAVWTKCHEVLAAVEAGERPAPTEAELIAELPEFVWPA